MEVTHRRNLNQIIDLSLPAAEVGTAEGYFAADILSWGVHKLYMIDNWGTLNGSGDGANSQAWHDKNYNDAKDRVKKYGEKAVMLKGLSTFVCDMIPDDSLGFVNIDCDHSYEGVKADIKAYWPKMKKGGVMAFHDYENSAYGVKTAVHHFVDSLPYAVTIHLLPEDKQEDAGCYIVKS